jgi:hypothetical protein
MQGYFTGGLYFILGLIGLGLVGKGYFFDNHWNVLDLCMSTAFVLIGAGFLIHTYFELKTPGKENYQETQGCFLPQNKK